MQSLKLKFTGGANSSEKDLFYCLLTVSNLDEEESWDRNEQGAYSDDNTTLAKVMKRKMKRNLRKNEDENERNESTSNTIVTPPPIPRPSIANPPTPRPPITKPLKKVKTRGTVATVSKMRKICVGFADIWGKQDEVMETCETPNKTNEQKREEQKVVENVEEDEKIGEEKKKDVEEQGNKIGKTSKDLNEVNEAVLEEEKRNEKVVENDNHRGSINVASSSLSSVTERSIHTSDFGCNKPHEVQTQAYTCIDGLMLSKLNKSK
ncbi:hypothetical protein RND81_04G006500 [Saponaria officinalis]|uniref:Uncharacterized protein n=1 Tax=Saponaria officinalis TaxID=3572 RepID=A0AAW1LFN5_SAPOF